MIRWLHACSLVVLPLLLFAFCATTRERSLVVTATAYNSLPEQTDAEPNLAAWGDELKPGMKVVAVSPDLLDQGLTHGVSVRIEGLPGRYVVLDRTSGRWRRRIDVYMGEDAEKALQWGKRQVRIYWRAE